MTSHFQTPFGGSDPRFELQRRIIQNQEQIIQKQEESLQTQEQIIQNQERVIQNQQKLIDSLKAETDRLSSKVAEMEEIHTGLAASYDEVVAMCKEQQSLLESMRGPS